MAWARVSKTIAGSSGGTDTTAYNFGNLSSTPSANDKLIAIVHMSQGDSQAQPHAQSIANSGGTALTWKKDASLAFHDVGNGYYEELSFWSAVADGTGVDSFTVTTDVALVSGQSGISVSVGGYSGLSTAASGDTDGNSLVHNTSGTTPASSTVVTTAANELVVGAWGDAGYNLTVSAGAGYTIYIKDDVNGTTESALEDKDSGASASSISAAFGLSGAASGIAGVVVYKLAGAAGGDTLWAQSLM